MPRFVDVSDGIIVGVVIEVVRIVCPIGVDGRQATRGSIRLVQTLGVEEPRWGDVPCCCLSFDVIGDAIVVRVNVQMIGLPVTIGILHQLDVDVVEVAIIVHENAEVICPCGQIRGQRGREPGFISYSGIEVEGISLGHDLESGIEHLDPPRPRLVTRTGGFPVGEVCGDRCRSIPGHLEFIEGIIACSGDVDVLLAVRGVIWTRAIAGSVHANDIKICPVLSSPRPICRPNNIVPIHDGVDRVLKALDERQIPFIDVQNTVVVVIDVRRIGDPVSVIICQNGDRQRSRIQRGTTSPTARDVKDSQIDRGVGEVPIPIGDRVRERVEPRKPWGGSVSESSRTLIHERSVGRGSQARNGEGVSIGIHVVH